MMMVVEEHAIHAGRRKRDDMHMTAELTKRLALQKFVPLARGKGTDERHDTKLACLYCLTFYERRLDGRHPHPKISIC